jgi:hypothetical protein
MLCDGEDRLSRPAFPRKFNIHTSTEKRARAEGLPWPPGATTDKSASVAGCGPSIRRAGVKRHA